MCVILLEHMTIEIVCNDLHDFWTKSGAVISKNAFYKSWPPGGAIRGHSGKLVGQCEWDNILISFELADLRHLRSLKVFCRNPPIGGATTGQSEKGALIPQSSKQMCVGFHVNCVLCS